MSEVPAIADNDANADRMTPMQEAFVVAYTTDPGAIGNAAEAARRAGYSTRSARELGRRLVDTPHVRAAIDQANRNKISGPIATLAIDVLEGILRDPDASRKDRAAVAFGLLDRGGFAPATAGERKAAAEARQRDASGRLYSDYTPEELDAAIARILSAQHQGPDNAKVIDGSAVEANDS